MTTPQQALNDAKAKAFTQLMISHLTGASVTLMIELGRRLGLFETMATCHRERAQPSLNGPG